MKTRENFTFRRQVAERTHDWDKLLDGGTYQLDKGEDYDCKSETMRVMAYSQGGKRDLFVRCAIEKDKESGNECVVLQATPMTEEQLEARKERAAKRAAGKPVPAVEGEVTEEEEKKAEEEIEQEEQKPEPEPVKPTTKPVAAKPPVKPTIANKSNGKKR